MGATTTVMTGQTDLFALIEETKLATPAPSLYGSPARGLAARSSEYQAWRAEHGGFGSLGRSHAWTVWITCPDTPTGRCQPTVLSADLRCDCDNRRDQPHCSCVGELMYRGACRGCDWEGEPAVRENTAAEHACDHAWPGWLEDGGPIRTARTRAGGRHVPTRTPYGGYDLADDTRPEAADNTRPEAEDD